ncbi:RNA polymerase III subunit Rpc25 [Chytriomyces sp. MP71]|nr:RNA polymerase III subunit Rpc25 [Chytriomyces sp. MP71]
MFVLKTLDDTVRILPAEQRKSLPTAVTDELNRKYSNKIKPKTGLCIRVFDVLDIGDGIVHACMDGSGMFPVKFRLIVFKPFTGEILTGKIVNASPEGLRVSMEFFDDILIPDYLLKPNTIYNKNQSQWVWQYQDEDSSEVQNMDMERGELIRFRVEVEHFNEVRPQTPLPGTNAMTPKMPSGTGKELRSSAYWIEV